MRKRIKIKVQREVVLDDVWYDDQWHAELVANGCTEDEALRTILESAADEDWSSLLEEVFGIERGQGPVPPAWGDAFVKAVTHVELVEA